MTQLPTPARLVRLAAGTTVALAGVAGATHAAGLPDTVGAAVGVLVFGGAVVTSAVNSVRPKVT